ncbi:hypothetical protein QFC21_007220 [Naganishia friedmannii]|uniref:Uncharacterized protein n=1 Tax=Naganishia friedmannii TaxID=89922 RepID=A0ACC2UX04_9TREE|nr:hypothetical protein QFC21_007220 [Naganishia friedmannii]
MAICDDSKRIWALVTGWPGAVNDQRVFDMSPIAILPRALEKGLMSPGQYILADGGYRVMRHVIVPYDRAPGQTLPREKET